MKACYAVLIRKMLLQFQFYLLTHYVLKVFYSHSFDASQIYILYTVQRNWYFIITKRIFLYRKATARPHKLETKSPIQFHFYHCYYSVIHSLIHPLIHPAILSFIDWFIQTFIDSFIFSHSACNPKLNHRFPLCLRSHENMYKCKSY